MNNPIQLSDRFNYKKLLRFTIPSIIMMVFTSVYSVVDGLFVSNFVGKTPFAAVNLVMPMLWILGSFGYMFGAGGSALIAKTLGEKDGEKANQLFSLFVYLSIAFGVFMAVMGFIFMEPLVRALGAEGQLLADSLIYARIFILALPTWILLYEFQLFFATAEKPKLGLWVSVCAGVTNVVLDALFIIVFQWGIAGAALASAISQVVGGLFPLVYFGRKNGSLLRLGKTKIDVRAILKCCSNGSSELMNGVAMSVIGIIINAQLLKYTGENGVAAYGVLMYVSMIFSAIFFGFSSGSAPIFSFHYGAKNHEELRGLLQKSIRLITLFSVAMFAFSELFASPISAIFVGYDKTLMAMTLEGFFIFSFAYLFMGFGIFISAFFTALNNGLLSAVISFLRTMVFQLGAVLLLPLLWGDIGIWLSVVVAECLALIVGVVCLFACRKKYQY